MQICKQLFKRDRAQRATYIYTYPTQNGPNPQTNLFKSMNAFPWAQSHTRNNF